MRRKSKSVKGQYIPKELLDMMRRQLAELEVWRERYPYAAGFVYEEANARIEGREPEFGPPLVIG